MSKDQNYHKEFECIGYKYLILLVLDACSLFSVFVNLSAVLNEKVFSHKSFQKLTSAEDVFKRMEIVIEKLDETNIPNLSLLSKKPDYYKINNSQYSTLVVTAFRLTFFIEQKTVLMETFYKGLKLSDKQKLILIGSILMRLNCHLLNDTFDFEYNFPFGKYNK